MLLFVIAKTKTIMPPIDERKPEANAATALRS
jgi:hypothetical protein